MGMHATQNIKHIGYVFTNCMFWVVWKWLTEGGQIKTRRAKSRIPYPHFIWLSPCGRKMYDVVPKAGKPTFPYILFSGVIREKPIRSKFLKNDSL